MSSGACPHISSSSACGTAGWLSAMLLTDVAARRGHATRVTVIESSKIGVIGVGEGSTAVFRQMLRRFNLDETEFLRKPGPRSSWASATRTGAGSGSHTTGRSTIRILWRMVPNLTATPSPPVAGGRGASLPAPAERQQGPLRAEGRAAGPRGPFHYAFHFDQAAGRPVAAQESQGIALIDDQVTGVELGGDGIKALTLESGHDSRATSSSTVPLPPPADLRTEAALDQLWRRAADQPGAAVLDRPEGRRGDHALHPCVGAEERLDVGHPTQGRIGAGYVLFRPPYLTGRGETRDRGRVGYEVEPRAIFASTQGG